MIVETLEGEHSIETVDTQRLLEVVDHPAMTSSIEKRTVALCHEVEDLYAAIEASGYSRFVYQELIRLKSGRKSEIRGDVSLTT